MSDERMCSKCGFVIHGEAMTMTIDGLRERKNPICRDCYERAIVGAGRSLSNVDRFYDEWGEDEDAEFD